MVYLIFFLANRWVGRTIDGPPRDGPAAGIDAALLLGFAAAHSVMARDSFKRRLTRVVPAGLERSTYALVSSLLLILLCWQWRPIPEPVWSVAAPAARATLYTAGVAGWLTSLAAMQFLGHLELFGLAQALAYARGEPPPRQALSRRGLHGVLRHPVYLGFLVAIWAAPEMSRGHLLFAGAMSLYILVGMRFEERALERRFGEEYRLYRRELRPFRPRFRARRRARAAASR